jgi:hypothetical protein
MNKYNRKDVVESPVGIGVVYSVITIAPPRWDENGEIRYQYDIAHHGTNSVYQFDEEDVNPASHALPSVLETFNSKFPAQSFVNRCSTFLIRRIKTFFNKIYLTNKQ